MGKCLSKCGSRNNRVAVNPDEDPLYGADYAARKWAEKRKGRRRKVMAALVAEVDDDPRIMDVDRSWSVPRAPRFVVSPTHDVALSTMDVDQPWLDRRRGMDVESRDSPDSSAATLSEEEGVIDKPIVTADNVTNKTLDCEALPTKSVNANIRTLLQLKKKTGEEHLAVVDVDSDEEFEIPNNKPVKVEQADDVQKSVRPSVIDLKQLTESCEKTVVKNNKEMDAVIKEPEVDTSNVNVVQPPLKPGVLFITVRPKTPEQDKIEFVPKPVVQHTPILPAVKKSEMVQKQSETASLDVNKADNNNRLVLATDCGGPSDCNGVKDSVPVLAPQAPDATQGVAAECGNNGETVNIPKKAKKARPRKAHPYTRERMSVAPQQPNAVDQVRCEPERTVKKKHHKDKRDYKDFASRLLKPSEKAQATEGQVLDGTLITWPKYVKNREDGGERKTGAESTFAGAPYRARTAWGGEEPSRAYKSNNVTAGTSQVAVNGCGETVMSCLNDAEAKRFVYQPPPFVVRSKVAPRFKEKKLSFHTSPIPEETDEEMEFSFSPENLRRYAKRRQEKLKRRPKTPFCRKSAVTVPTADEPADVITKPADQHQQKSPKPETILYNGSKCVSFVIPGENRKDRLPTSRPNTRRQMRPTTARANAEELALRQANAEKRREQVLKSRAKGLRKKKARTMSKEDAEKAKAAKLKEKMERKMKRHRENREKNIDEIVAKQTEHIQHVKDKHDVIFTRKRFMGLEKDTAPDPTSVQYTINDLVEIDRFFDEMDKLPSSSD